MKTNTKRKNNQQALLALTRDPSIFTMPGTVGFAADGDEGKNKVLLTLYDGSVVKHWYWGNLAFELSSMKMAKKRNPILYRHDVNQRLAFSDITSFDDKFTMEGTFLNTPIAQQIKQELNEGFPFEASLKFDPARTNILNVAENKKVQVNGRTLKGPGSVMKNALILEGSICVFGALKDTTSKAFEIEEERDIETPVNKQPKNFWDAVEQEMKKDTSDRSEVSKRAAATRLCVTKYPELHEAFLEGTQTESSSISVKQPADFNEAIKQRMKADTSDKSEISKRADAIRYCVAKYPKLHQKFLEELSR